MTINISTTDDKRGRERLKRLLPQLKDKGLKYNIYYGDLTLDPLEYTYNTFKKVLEDNKDNPYYIYVEDDAVLSSKVTEKYLMDLIDSTKDFAAIVSLGSHNFGQYKVISQDRVDLEEVTCLQFIIVHKRGYETIEKVELEVNQERVIKSLNGQPIMTVVPFEVMQDNLLGSRTKNYPRDVEEGLRRYEQQMIKSIKEKYC